MYCAFIKLSVTQLKVSINTLDVRYIVVSIFNDAPSHMIVLFSDKPGAQHVNFILICATFFIKFIVRQKTSLIFPWNKAAFRGGGHVFSFFPRFVSGHRVHLLVSFDSTGLSLCSAGCPRTCRGLPLLIFSTMCHRVQANDPLIIR